jgi:hypothetical protein
MKRNTEIYPQNFRNLHLMHAACSWGKHIPRKRHLCTLHGPKFDIRCTEPTFPPPYTLSVSVPANQKNVSAPFLFEQSVWIFLTISITFIRCLQCPWLELACYVGGRKFLIRKDISVVGKNSSGQKFSLDICRSSCKVERYVIIPGKS